MTELEYAYIAGLFDGEGCIQIIQQSKRRNGRTTPYCLSVCISNTDTKVMRWLYASLGGVLIDRPGRNGGSCSWSWQTYTNNAATFLEHISPFLVIKRAECDTALEFSQHMQEQKHAGYERKGVKKGRPVLSPDILAYRQSLCDRLKHIRLARKRY